MGIIRSMPKPRRLLRTPFVSALLGGAIVAVFGAIAIAAGWIQSDGDSTTTVAAPLTAPVVDRSGHEGDANVVNQIYKARRRRRRLHRIGNPAAGNREPSLPSANRNPKAAAPRPARAS